MSRQRATPAASHLVGEAVYDVRFPMAHPLSPELVQRIESLLNPAGGWSCEVRPSGFTLKTREYQGLGDLPARLHRISSSCGAFEEDGGERIVLKYSSAVPVEPRVVKKLFAERVTELIPDSEEGFTQELSGTWGRGRYSLNYGVHALKRFSPTGEKVYHSSAYVTAEHVATESLGDVFQDLDREGLRLLSWPIARGSIKALPNARNYSDWMDSEIRHWAARWVSTADDPAKERAELIARKYSGEPFSSADEYRLNALTEKVRALLPQVATKDWQVLAEVSSRLDQIEERTQQSRKKYGLAG